MRVWLDVLHADLAGARAILKLGPAQEVAVPVQPLLEGVGRLGQSAISSSPIWKTKDGISVAGPSPPCIFVQIWQGAELCGLAKLVLSPLTPECAENINLQGYEQILQEDVDVLAVSTNRSIGKLRVLLHAGLESILEALQEPQPSQLPKARNQIVTEAAAGMMTLCCLSLEALQLLESDLKGRMSETVQNIQNIHKVETDVETAEKTDGLRKVDPATLQGYQPLLTPEEADSLALWLSEPEGTLWSLMSRIHIVNESFDQLIKEVGDECTSVALDFLDVAAPSKLQRQDIARILRFRGIELGWNTLERIFMALGCSKYEKDSWDSSSEAHSVPVALQASSFAQLFKSRAERRMLEVAGLRQLEAKVLAWWRWRDPPGQSKVGNGQVKPVKPVSTVSATDLVFGFSKSDGTVDLIGLKVLLASMNGPFQQHEVENLAQWLFEGFGARPGGGVPKDLVVQWLTGDGTIWKMKDENNEEVAESPRSQETTPVPAGAKAEQIVHLSSPNPAQIPSNIQDVRNPSPTHGNPHRLSDKVPVSQASHVSQATIQLSKPLEGRHSERLTEVLSTSLQHPLHQIKVFGAEEGSSRICVVIQGDELSTCEAAMRDLALQLKDPSSSLQVRC